MAEKSNYSQSRFHTILDFKTLTGSISIPEKHFISFDSPDYTTQVIEYYLSNETEHTQIVAQEKKSTTID